jgi:hypothetical protein
MINNELPKLLVVGDGRHGKDTFCEMAESFGFVFISSSWIMSDYVFGIIGDSMGYLDSKTCWEDRLNNRNLWMKIVNDYNENDPSRLCRKILETNNIYCGLRSYKEFIESRHLFDCVVYIDAVERLGKTDSTNEIPSSEADVVIYNNRTIQDFESISEMYLKEIINDFKTKMTHA